MGHPLFLAPPSKSQAADRSVRFTRTLTALWAARFGLFEFLAKSGIGRWRRNHLGAAQEPLVGGLVEDLAEGGHQDSRCFDESAHPLSSASRVITNGASFTRDSCWPLRTPIHWRTDSISTRATITTRTAVTAASRRLLKISRALAFVAGLAAQACA